jgi:hypothetical protein
MWYNPILIWKTLLANLENNGLRLCWKLKTVRYTIYVCHIFYFLFFILFYKIRRTKQILNLYKYLRVHWLGLTTEINSNNGVPRIKIYDKTPTIYDKTPTFFNRSIFYKLMTINIPVLEWTVLWKTVMLN